MNFEGSGPSLFQSTIQERLKKYTKKSVTKSDDTEDHIKMDLKTNRELDCAMDSSGSGQASVNIRVCTKAQNFFTNSVTTNF
jgi:hypothetical protein